VLLAVDGWPRLQPLEQLTLGALTGLTAWTFVSSFWSISVTRSMLEGERILVYLSAVLAVLVLRRRGAGLAVVVGVWLAVTAVCTYALLTRLFPKQFGVSVSFTGDRLSTPIGYWNGLALFAAIGCLLALGLAARGRLWLRMAAAASTVVLGLTLYFTYGRAGWIALIAGALAAVLLDRRRLHLAVVALVVAPWSALAVYYASRASSLTHVDVPTGAAQKDGHAVAVMSVVLITAAALSVLLLEALERRGGLEPGPRVRRVVAGLVACVLVALLALAFAHYGSPTTIAADAWHSFTSKPTTPEINLNTHLFQLSGSGRIDQWRVAGREIAAHPWLGSGAGTFGEYWFRLRPSRQIVHDTHNLYLETLAETGPIGLALLVLFLAGLITGAVRSRSPYAAVVVGACVAYALHAAGDWDWELPALLLAVLLPALAISGPDHRPSVTAPVANRVAPTVAVLAVGAFALFALLGNIALARSSNASDATHWRQAESEARSAIDLVPWSAEPWRKLAVAQAGLGEIDAARASLQTAVADDPNDWTLWYQLSEVTTGALHRRALAEANRLNPHRNRKDATPGDLRLVVIP
jgi:hypothetical protein